VFYSDQGAVFTEAAPDGGDDLTGGVSRSAARRLFSEFLRGFRGEPSPGRVDGETVYRDALDADPPPKELTVVLEDLLAFDAQLADALKKNPRTFVPLVRLALGAVRGTVGLVVQGRSVKSGLEGKPGSRRSLL
jgi:MCM N-terminal domain